MRGREKNHLKSNQKQQIEINEKFTYIRNPELRGCVAAVVCCAWNCWGQMQTGLVGWRTDGAVIRAQSFQQILRLGQTFATLKSSQAGL